MESLFDQACAIVREQAAAALDKPAKLAAMKAEVAQLTRADRVASARCGFESFPATVTLGDEDFDATVYWEDMPDRARVEFCELRRYCGNYPADLPEGVFVTITDAIDPEGRLTELATLERNKLHGRYGDWREEAADAAGVSL